LKAPFLRAWLAGLRRLLPFALLASLQGADVLRLLLNDRRRRGVPALKHDRRPANTYNMYKPKMIAVSTTCMAEVIGDDPNAFIRRPRRALFRRNTTFPSLIARFRRTHHRLRQCDQGRSGALLGRQAGTAPVLERVPQRRFNFLGGFDGYTVGNLREIKRIFNSMRANTRSSATTRRLGYTDRWRVPHV